MVELIYVGPLIIMNLILHILYLKIVALQYFMVNQTHLIQFLEIICII